MSLNALRVRYDQIRSNVVWTSHCTSADFDAAVKALIPESPEPKHWIMGALKALVKCGRCAGTGQFVTMVKNGKPTGPGGICYRCEGKGRQNYTDAKRNTYYDKHQIVRL